jgi:GH15 family glucan-1,4-alpha-glucosidase
VPHAGRHFRSYADFDVIGGDEVAFDLTHGLSYEPIPPAVDVHQALEDTSAHWRAWIAKAEVDGPYGPVVRRSLLTLKALSNARTGGIVAAATTSLPEQPGGTRNWDYRYCWLRDSTLTLLALLQTGFVDEARAWRDWLLRACAGSPADMQIMYGVGGERLLPEWEADWLPGHEGARPVRIGNLASRQRQLDIFGEVADVMFQASIAGYEPDLDGLQRGIALMKHVAKIWREPDYGMWEVRGEPRHFTHSKVMAWVAVDRFVRLVEELDGVDIDLQPWRALCGEIHDWVCRECIDPAHGWFVQAAGCKGLDAALLMLPLVGFLPPQDPRMVATVAGIERHLVQDGLVRRYITDPAVDGLPPGEGTFIACSFWLVDNLVLQGRVNEARALYERLLALCNDVGLLSEEYEPASGRMLGNFPQAFSHVGIVNSALNLERVSGPAKQRAEKGGW